MATETQSQYSLHEVLGQLASSEWSVVLRGITDAGKWLQDAPPGEPGAEDLVDALVGLSRHPKWEVRRAIVQVAGQVLHAAFEPALARLATDDNSRVRQAAEQASARRRDWKNASLLGRQHEDRINAKLDDIELRFGPRARDAVRRTSEEIANTFSRELYHEVVKLVTPLAMSADRLGKRLAEDGASRAELHHEAMKIQERVQRLQTILNAMRAFTAVPQLDYSQEYLREIVEEAASLVRDSNQKGRVKVGIEVSVDPTLTADVVRSRLVQAFTNILFNAVESYEGLEGRDPVIVRSHTDGSRITLTFQDAGCGMSAEVLKDAPVLFSTSKPHGTGFGLPLAIKIIESEHAGRLALTSHPQIGTRVEILLLRHRA